MEPVAIPKTIDDPIHILLWSADEIVPFMVCMLTGMLIDHFIPALALGVIAVKFYRRFRDNRPDGYLRGIQRQRRQLQNGRRCLEPG